MGVDSDFQGLFRTGTAMHFPHQVILIGSRSRGFEVQVDGRGR